MIANVLLILWKMISSIHKSSPGCSTSTDVYLTEIQVFKEYKAVIKWGAQLNVLYFLLIIKLSLEKDLLINNI